MDVVVATVYSMPFCYCCCRRRYTFKNESLNIVVDTVIDTVLVATIVDNVVVNEGILLGVKV